MTLHPSDEELTAVLEEYELPELPEPADEEDGEGDGTVRLVLFRFKDETIRLADDIPLAGAQEYCDREDTHGNGWFAGFWRN